MGVFFVIEKYENKTPAQMKAASPNFKKQGPFVISFFSVM